MSKENARALIAKMKSDRALGERVVAAGDDGFEEEAHRAGCPCTLHDIGAVVVEDGELTEEELEQIAGGDNDFHSLHNPNMLPIQGLPAGQLDNPLSEPDAAMMAGLYAEAALLYLPSVLGKRGH
jgi:predicted ribosomally synthesized peptide with nif11-like leader